MYYSIVNNISNSWNNPYRTSKKFYSYYHKQNDQVRESHPSDSEKLKSTIDEQERKMRIAFSIGRTSNINQLKVRKASREALQLSGSQTLIKSNPKIIDHAIINNQSNSIVEFAMPITYKDPSKNENPCSV